MLETISPMTAEEKQKKGEEKKIQLEAKVKEINERLVTVFQKYIQKFGKRFEVRVSPKFCIYDHKRLVEAVCVSSESKGRIPIYANSEHEEDLPTFLKAEKFDIEETKNDSEFAILVDKK